MRHGSNYWNFILPSKLKGISIYNEVVLAFQLMPKGIALCHYSRSWDILSQRNGKIFKTESLALNTWKHLLKQDLILMGHRVKRKNVDCLQSWIDTHL
uniref:Uncharacterized protein n=1 Tax=Triticum urartu TaxID=4572 RepID=A0A8R7P4E2_TRIUA